MVIQPCRNRTVSGVVAAAAALRQRVRAWGPVRLLGVVLAGAAAAVLLGGVGWGLVWPQLLAAWHWRQAQAAEQQGDFLAAREHLRVCVQVWPASGETHFRLGRVCRRGGDYAAARQHLDLARRHRWPAPAVDLELLLLEAQIHGARGHDASTLQHYVLSHKHPEEKLILEALVKGYLHNFYLRDAEFWLDYWIDVYPEDWIAYFWRGQLRERLGLLEEACQDYRESLRLAPEQIDAELRLASVLQQKGIDLAEAQARFERYVRLRPEDARAWLGLARCQRGLGQRQAARETLARLTPDQPLYPKALLLQALLASDEERYDQALAWLQEAERRDPHEPDIVYQMAEVLEKLGRSQEAQAYAQRRQRLEADLRELAEITRSLTGNPGDVDKRYRAGVILLRVGQEEGVRWLLTVLREDPQHRATHAALAEFYARSADPQQRRLAEFHRQQAQGKPPSP
jgi:tetratricopeptide (TPR) repeat protein